MVWRCFRGQHHVIDRIPLEWGDETIKNEPMLFGADLPFANQNGGILTRLFLLHLIDRVPLDDRPWLVDSRVHMLKAGWYPAIPGWHLDSIPRSKTNRQPDFEQDTSRLQSFMMVVGQQAPTEFLSAGSDVRLWCPDGKRWSEFSRDIRSLIQDGEVTVDRVEPNTIVRFGPKDFHRATPALGDGWRFFIRATKAPDLKPVNEIRRQTQVYLHELEAGW